MCFKTATFMFTPGCFDDNTIENASAAALVNSLLPNSASHLPLPYTPSPADGGWCRVETAPALLNPLTTCKKWDRRGYTFPVQPRACLCSARPCPRLKKRPLVSPAGKHLSVWEPIFPQCFGTDHSFPSLFGNVGAF